MTAYVARLLPRQGTPAGIRPRPRSRYEPEPHTNLGRDPREPSEEGEPADNLRGHGEPSHDAQRAAPHTSDGDPKLTEPVTAQLISASRRQRATQPAPPAPGAHDDHPLNPTTNPRVATPDPERSTRVARQVGEGSSQPHRDGPTADDGASDDWSLPPRPPRNAALSVVDSGSATAPSWPGASSDPGRPRPGPNADDDPFTAARGSAPSPTDPPPLANRADETPVLRPDPVYADQSYGRHRGSLDRALRQAIVNAVAEPVRVDTTEVSVHIDRIDVGTPASSAPPVAEPRARATPTSLDSYLRSRSRRAGR
jgi:hypothetical protein